MQWEAVGRVHQEMPNMKGSEAANVFKSAAIAAGINSEKSLLRRGQPTQIRREETLTEVLKALKERFPNAVSLNPVLLGEAEEMPDARLEKGS